MGETLFDPCLPSTGYSCGDCHRCRPPEPVIHKAASISACGRYRYGLHRWWEPDRARLAFIMLNPSTADAEQDDPTIRRCLGFARALGFDGIRVFNLYAYRATKPVDLWKADEPTGGERNNDLLREVLRQAKYQLVIAAWGANAKPERVAEFMSWPGSEHIRALGLTKAGGPRHPLYLPGDSLPIPLPTRYTAPTPDTP